MRLGVVIQWASAFFELRKKVSGIQIFPTMLLLRRRTFIVLLNFNLLSYQVWAKKMSMVYSWARRRHSFSLNAEHAGAFTNEMRDVMRLKCALQWVLLCFWLFSARANSVIGVYSSQEVLLSPLKSSLEKDHPNAFSLKIKCSTGQLIIPIVWLQHYLTS